MTQAVILAAGMNTRGDGTFKPRVSVGDRNVWKWQQPELPKQVTIVGPSIVRCSTAGAMPGADYFTFDGLGGPVRALDAVLPELDSEGPLVVCYADTIFFGFLPAGDWCGVSPAEGGRVWDYKKAGSFYTRRHVPMSGWVDACIGLYQFSDMVELGLACKEVLASTEPGDQAQMWRVANRLALRPVAFEWFDVGDPEAVTAAVAGLKKTGRLPA